MKYSDIPRARKFMPIHAVLVGAALSTAGTAAAFTAPSCTTPSAATSPNEPPVVDMTAEPEGLPHGTIAPDGKEFDWGRKPRVWRGNNPQTGWSVVASTAMVYAVRDKPVSYDIRIQVRNIELFVKPRRRGSWCLLDRREAPTGGFYVENFAGDVSKPAQLRAEASGGISVKMQPGYNFHFWGNKVSIPAEGLDGVYVQYEARQIPDDDITLGVLDAAGYVAAASADYWKSMSALSGQVGILNEDVAIGRFICLSQHWRTISMNSNGGPTTAMRQR